MTQEESHRRRRSPEPPRKRRFHLAALALLAVLLLAGTAFLVARHWMRSIAQASLPQLSGSITTPGLTAAVTITRDPRGIPSLHAQTPDDLFFAQGFVTAQDRLFQMDSLRRHAAGSLAEILGASLLPHDRLQRTLALGPAADRILTQLPPSQLHAFERYAAGVNAQIALARPHLPLEFRILAYQPRPWTPRDCVLVSLILFEDLTNTFPTKLNREALTARLAPSATPEQRAELLADLYPVASWRDHPPSQPATDLTNPVESIPDIPLDDSQVHLRLPASPTSRTGCSFFHSEQSEEPALRPATATPHDLLALSTLTTPLCPDCLAGSNNFAVSGVHTASGKPLLANDMHLTLSAPGIWYAVNLQAANLHVAGVSLPGVPFVVVGHNDHVAWSFTNLGADVQDLYLEHLRGAGPAAEFQTPAGAWQPVLHRPEVIQVRGGRPVTLDLQSTVHGATATPLVNPVLPSETRPIALRWSLYDTDHFSLPFDQFAAAPSAAGLLASAATYTGPAQNLITGDDAGHIAFHAIGRIPLRGSALLPSPLSPVPTDATGPDAAAHEWTSTIPYDQLPATLDPASGLLATANARTTPDAYPFPVTLNWVDPYRNERIWRLLAGRNGLKPEDMLRIQTDVYSDADHRLAQRLAYAIDRSPKTTKRLRAAADLLRAWDGQVAAASPAAAIAAATREALWPLLLTPQLAPAAVASDRQPSWLSSRIPSLLSSRSAAEGSAAQPQPSDPTHLYTWNSRNFALEQLIAHTPARWLPSAFATWDDLLTAAVDKALTDANAPANLAKWSAGKQNPLEVQFPLFAQLPILRTVIGLRTGTGVRPQSGNALTVRQSRRAFGPSERFTADLANPDAATLVLPLGQSGNPASPWFLDQFPAWLDTATYPLPFTTQTSTQTLTLTPN